MTDHHANPPRLKDRHDQPDLVERMAGQAARDLPEPPHLSAGALARIAQRIERQNGKPRTLRLGRVLVAASLLLGMVTVASAARMDLMPRWMAKMMGREDGLTEETPSKPGKARSARKRSETPPLPAVLPTREPTQTEAPAPGAEEVAVGPLPPTPTPTPVPANTASPRRKLALVTHPSERSGRDPGPGAARKPDGQGQAPMFPPVLPPPSPAIQAPPTPALPLAPPSERPAPLAPPVPLPAPAPPSSVEGPAPLAPPVPAPVPATAATTASPAARHLKDVVRALRVEYAPRTALNLLDLHAGDLKGSAFADEALLLRVEAMLALRQQPEALRLLDEMSLAHTASSSVLLVTRGQLRANANRCAEAVADFDLALARTLRPSKPALLGRAQCKQKLGDAKAAQADMDRLQREFPAKPAP